MSSCLWFTRNCHHELPASHFAQSSNPLLPIQKSHLQTMGATPSQIFPPSPTLTEKNLLDQTGKVPLTLPIPPPSSSPSTYTTTTRSSS